MAQYEVRVFCNECFETHRTGIVINLNNGPADQGSVGDCYNGKDVPQEIINMQNNSFVCPTTHKMFTQKDNKQVFLVAIK
jgi:hypothetical protein